MHSNSLQADSPKGEGDKPAPGTLKFERMADLEARVSLKKSQLWKLIREGQFPTPIKQGRSSLFIVAEVDEWMRARIRESRGGAK